jgi:hypothetical protein
MPLPELPLKLLLRTAHHIRDDHGKLRSGDFNSFLLANRALYAGLNRMLWKEAEECEGDHRHPACTYVLTYSIKANNLAGLKVSLTLCADFAVDLESGIEWLFEPTPLLIAVRLDKVPLACPLSEKGARVQYRGKFSLMHATGWSAEMVQLLGLAPGP